MNALMKNLNNKKIIIALTSCALIICAFLFSKTNGLVEKNDAALFVKDLLTSGSDDNVCIEISRILFIPFILLIFTIKKQFALWEFLLGNFIFCLQIIFLLSIESGSIISTINQGNLPLVLWLICFIALFIEIYISFFAEKLTQKN